MTGVTMEVRSLRRSSTGVQTLGPLPALHRFLMVLAALVVCGGIGLWLGAMPEVPVNLRAGLLVGAVAGVAAAFVLVHDHHRRTRPARARRRVF